MEASVTLTHGRRGEMRIEIVIKTMGLSPTVQVMVEGADADAGEVEHAIDLATGCAQRLLEAQRGEQ